VRNPILKQAVVVGAGMAGLAAAKAIAPHFEKVTVFDRDSLPDAPAPRSGTPQSRLTHALLAGGHSRSIVCFPGSRPISWTPARSGYGFAAICGWSCPASIRFLNAILDTTSSLCRARRLSASAATGSNRSRISKSRARHRGDRLPRQHPRHGRSVRGRSGKGWGSRS
jgi:hypothetical protein